MTMSANPTHELTIDDVFNVVNIDTGHSYLLRCARAPIVDDDPDCGAVLTWAGTLHDALTGEKVGEFTVPDHYPEPYIVWT
jgi:hypothetical protein